MVVYAADGANGNFNKNAMQLKTSPLRVVIKETAYLNYNPKRDKQDMALLLKF